MKKELIIGMTVSVSAAVIIGGALLIMHSQGENNSRRIETKQNSTASEEDRRKIEKIAWEELKDIEKYSFCLAEAKIESYVDLPGMFKGNLRHNSKEVLLYDKEAKKLYVLSQEADYTFKGTHLTIDPMGSGFIDLPTSGHGTINETYSKSENQIRIDYANNYISTVTAPKKNLWVSQTYDDETEMVMPVAGCEGILELYQTKYSAGNFAYDDMVFNDDLITIDRKCKGNIIGVAYDGSFSFSCATIDHRKAKELVDEVKAKEKLQNAEDAEASKNRADEDAYEESQRQTLEEMQKSLKELNDEMEGRKAPSGI